MYGRKHSEETRRRMSDWHKNNKHPMKGKEHSEETKRKMSESQRGQTRPRGTCPHCGKEASIPNLKRWHFEKCKHNHE
jgi:hypothetical protein